MEEERFAMSARDRAEIEQIHALVASKQADGLIAFLRTDRWTVRRAAIASLAELGSVAIEPLVKTLREDRDSERQIAALVDVLSIMPTDATAQIEALASDGNAAIVCDCAAILGRRRSTTSVPLLARLTKHEDDNVAVSAVEALGRIGGESVVEALIELVATGTFFRVFPAIDVLGRTGDPRATEALARLLQDSLYAPDAARALGRTGDPRAITALIELLARSTDATVRVACVALIEVHDRTFGRFGSPSDRAKLDAPSSVVERLLQALSSADEDEETAIVRVLGLLRDESAIARLIELVTTGRTRAVSAAENVLRDLGAATLTPLLDAISQGNSEQRAILLPLIGARAGDAAPILECLGDESPRVRALAADTLARMGNTTAVPLLFAALRDPDARVVQAAVAAIQSLGSAETEPLAVEASRDPNPSVRRASIRVLAYFGFPGAIQPLLDALADADERVREVALSGLPLLDSPAATAALFAAAADPSPRTRAAAVRALGHASTRTPVVESLVTALSDADAWVRYYACQALGRRQEESAVEALIACLGDDAGHVRVGAIEALAHLRDSRAGDALVEAVQDREPDMQRAAILGLGQSGRAGALAMIAPALHDDDTATRLVAVSALAALPGVDALELIVAATRDRDMAVSSAAINVLGARPEIAAFEVLLPLLDDEGTAERAFLAISEPVSGRVAVIASALQRATAQRATSLAAALTRMNRPEANAALIAALSSPTARVRRAAAAALAAVPLPEHRSAIQHAFDREGDADVRSLLRRALSTEH